MDALRFQQSENTQPNLSANYVGMIKALKQKIAKQAYYLNGSLSFNGRFQADNGLDETG
jgi:hypothetical protein